MGEMRCPSCGWENEASARLCGGCGRPLRTTAAPSPYTSGRYAARGPNSAYRVGSGGPTAYGRGDATDPYMPTVRDYPLPPRYIPPASPRPAGWAAPRQAPVRRRTTSVALIALMLLAVLGLLAAGVWAAGIRPPLHQRVDALMRAQMLAMVATVNQVPAIPTTTVTLSGDQATANLQAAIPTDVPLQNVQVTFQGERTVVSFTTYGMSGTASTQLVTANGRLTATNTTVAGPVGLVENGVELQAALNTALGNLRHDVTIKQVTEQNNVLTVSIQGNV